MSSSASTASHCPTRACVGSARSSARTSTATATITSRSAPSRSAAKPQRRSPPSAKVASQLRIRSRARSPVASGPRSVQARGQTYGQPSARSRNEISAASSGAGWSRCATAIRAATRSRAASPRAQSSRSASRAGLEPLPGRGENVADCQASGSLVARTAVFAAPRGPLSAAGAALRASEPAAQPRARAPITARSRPTSFHWHAKRAMSTDA